MGQAFVEEYLLETRRARIHVETPGSADQVFELVRNNAGCYCPHEAGRAHVLVYDTFGIRNEQVKHFRDVARRARFQVAGRRFWKEVPTEEESTDVGILTRRSQLVDGPCEEKDYALIPVDVRWVAKVLRIDGIDQRIEGDTKEL